MAAKKTRTAAPADTATKDTAPDVAAEAAPAVPVTPAPDMTPADAVAAPVAADGAVPAAPATPAAPVVSAETIQDAMRIMAEEVDRRAVAEAELAKAQAEEEARRQKVLADLAKARTTEETRRALADLLAAVTTTYAAVIGGDEAAVTTGLETIYTATNDVRRASRVSSARTSTATGTASGGVTVRTDRAAPRPLRPEVAAHLTAYPDAEFTPGEIAKVLGRSSGAVSNALDTLVKAGEAVLTAERPHRYRTATAASTTADGTSDTTTAGDGSAPTAEATEPVRTA